MGLGRQCLIAATALLSAGAAKANHSFAAIFDSEKPVTLTGTVASVEWVNPHFTLFYEE